MPKRRLMWIALVIVYVLWGSTYLAMSYLVDTVPPFLGAGARYASAGLLLAAVLAARSGASRLRVSPRELGSAALVGALLLVGGNGLVMMAERTVPSGLAALAVAAVPLFVVLLRLAVRDRPPLSTLLGVVLGFLGIATLVHPGGHANGGVLIIIAAALSWSIGSFLAPRLPMPADAFVGTVYEMVCGGLLLVVVSAARGEPGRFALGEVSASSWIAFGYLILFGSLVAFTAYVWLLQNAPLSTVSTYAYVNPAVAVALGTLTGEPFTWQVAVGGAAVIAAVAIVVSTEERGRAEAPGEPLEDGPDEAAPELVGGAPEAAQWPVEPSRRR